MALNTSLARGVVPAVKFAMGPAIRSGLQAPTRALAENAAMMHIARKLGMNICVDTGEADAFLRLPPADPVSVTGEFVEQRLALVDYALKAQAMRIKALNAPARPPEG